MLTSHQLAKLLLEQPDMPVIEYSRDDYGPAYGIQVHEDAALDENGEFVDTSYEFAEKYSSVHVKKGKVVSLR